LYWEYPVSEIWDLKLKVPAGHSGRYLRNAYLNPYAEIFKVSQDYIHEYVKAHPIKTANGSSPKPLLQVKYLPYNDHFENMKTVINKWTSVGIYMTASSINTDSTL